MTEARYSVLTERTLIGWVCLAVVAAGMLAYANTFSGDFVWDDASSILLHRHVQDPSKFFQLFREDQHAFGRGQGNFYRPLVSASFMLDFLCSRPAEGEDLSPFVFHLTNLLWHAAAAALLALLLARLGAPRFVRVVVPMVYVLHPLHTEAVAYISGRADMMSAAFMYAGLCLALWNRTPLQRVAGTILSGLCFCGGLLSKESSFIYPVLLVIVLLGDTRVSGTGRRDYVCRAGPLVLAVVLMGVYAWLRTSVLQFASQSTPGSGFGQRVVETLQSFAAYMGLLFVPTGLHMERTLAGATAWSAVAGALLLGILVAAAVVALVRGERRIAMGLAWFLASWLPISGLFPLNAPMAEHWMYVPMAGFLWALAEALWIVARPRAARVALAGVTAVFGLCMLGLTVARNRDWRDNETLFLATLEQNPASARVQFNLAVTYEDILHNLPGARRHYEEVLRLYEQKRSRLKGSAAMQRWDDELESQLSLGRILAQEQRYGEAARHFSAVLSIEPSDAHRAMMAEAAMGLGECHMAFGDSQKAIELFKRAIGLQPELKDRIQGMLGSA